MHKARHTGIGHAGLHLQTPSLYGPPAPHVSALCSKTPGTALAAGPGAPAAGAAPTAADAASSAPYASGVPAGGGGGAPALPGAAGVSPIPVFGAAKAALLAAALVAGLGTAAIALTPASDQPATATTAAPGSTPDQQSPLINFASVPPTNDDIPDSKPDLVPPNRVPSPNIATAVPEPASLLTLALGGALATLLRRRH